MQAYQTYQAQQQQQNKISVNHVKILKKIDTCSSVVSSPRGRL